MDTTTPEINVTTEAGTGNFLQQFIFKVFLARTNPFGGTASVNNAGRTFTFTTAQHFNPIATNVNLPESKFIYMRKNC